MALVLNKERSMANFPPFDAADYLVNEETILG